MKKIVTCMLIALTICMLCGCNPKSDKTANENAETTTQITESQNQESELPFDDYDSMISGAVQEIERIEGLMQSRDEAISDILG